MRKDLITKITTLFFLISPVACTAVLTADQQEISRATELLSQGKADEAIAIVNGELQKNPSSADSEVVLGHAYLQKNDFTQARIAFEKAISLNPAIFAAHFHLAFIYEHDGNNTRALEEWKKVDELATSQHNRDLAKKHIQQLEGK